MSQKVHVSNARQKDYRYIRTARVGRDFHPEFRPELTPHEMLTLGVFGGSYLDVSETEFPRSWFRGVRLSADGAPQAHLNYFGVNASQSRAEWLKRGWIHPDDPRGWFEWYCRYYLGRRHEDDLRQIKRWKAVRRHAAQISSHCRHRDLACRKRQRQALLHWAYDSRAL